MEMEIRIREWLFGEIAAYLPRLDRLRRRRRVRSQLCRPGPRNFPDHRELRDQPAYRRHAARGESRTEQHGWQSPKSAGKYGTEGAIGAAASAGQIKVTWHVENQNSLIRYAEYPQHIDTVHLMVSGQSCQATISRRLKPGFSTYERFNRDWSPVFFEFADILGNRLSRDLSIT